MYNLKYNRTAIMDRLSKVSGLEVAQKNELADSMYEAAHTSGYYGRFLLASIHGNLLNSDIARMLSKLSTPILIVTGSADRQAKKHCRPLISTRKIYPPSFSKISAPHSLNVLTSLPEYSTASSIKYLKTEYYEPDTPQFINCCVSGS